jgi:hypothetical protein
MSEFYIKNGNKYIPVDIKKYFTKDLENSLVIMRIGTDDMPASQSDLDITEKSLFDADVLGNLKNVSIVVTPYQIDVDAVDKNQIGDKNIYLQICICRLYNPLFTIIKI